MAVLNKERGMIEGFIFETENLSINKASILDEDFFIYADIKNQSLYNAMKKKATEMGLPDDFNVRYTAPLYDCVENKVLTADEARLLKEFLKQNFNI